MDSPQRRFALAIAGILACQIALLALAGYQNLYWMNPDGVAYLRLAHYYATGQIGLAISAYWGPLISWLIAPLLIAGVPPLAAARFVVAGSAVVFVLGAAFLFRMVRLPFSAVAVGSALCALATVTFFPKLNPDLLAAGVICAGTGLLLRPAWLLRRRAQLVAGGLFGAAYLAKPIALPFVIACALSMGPILSWCRGRPASRGLAAALVTIAAALVLVAPWLVVISIDAGGPTLSTSGRINHSIIGPPDIDRYHPVFRRFHHPEPGRITQWENPRPDEYAHWSPLADWGAFRHQVSSVARNSLTIVRHILRYDSLGVGLLGMLSAFAFARPWRERMARESWRWCVVPCALLIALHLPFYAEEARYFYAVFPLAIGATLGIVHHHGRGRPVFLVSAYLLVLASFFPLGVTGIVDLVRQGFTQKGWYRVDYEAGKRLRRAGVALPVADTSGFEGLYVAFFANVPYLGSEGGATRERLVNSGAGLVVTRRGDAVAARLARDPVFEDLDSLVFPDPRPPRQPRLKLFRVRRESP